MHFVYVLQSKSDGGLYIGMTVNPDRRLMQHNAGSTASTSYRRPLELIYYEAYLNKLDAIGREKFLKSGAGWRFLKKQLKNHYEKL